MLPFPRALHIIIYVTTNCVCGQKGFLDSLLLCRFAEILFLQMAKQEGVPEYCIHSIVS